MNDKIELWKDKTKGIFHITEYTIFWNYISNLQQENERLKEENELVRCDIHNAYSRERGAIRELEDYKYRCEKASEYINKQKKKMYKSKNKIALFILIKLESILNPKIIGNSKCKILFVDEVGGNNDNS